MSDEVKKAGNGKFQTPIEFNLNKVHIRESEVAGYLQLN